MFETSYYSALLAALEDAVALDVATVGTAVGALVIRWELTLSHVAVKRRKEGTPQPHAKRAAKSEDAKPKTETGFLSWSRFNWQFDCLLPHLRRNA